MKLDAGTLSSESIPGDFSRLLMTSVFDNQSNVMGLGEGDRLHDVRWRGDIHSIAGIITNNALTVRTKEGIAAVIGKYRILLGGRIRKADEDVNIDTSTK
jgi:hypothetical protein